VSADPDAVVLVATPGPQHANTGGIVHGGYLSALLDVATGWAALAGLPAGRTCPHSSLSVSYVRAALPGQELRCTAHAMRVGRTTASSEAVVTTPDGRTAARALSSHTVVDLRAVREEVAPAR
jgi:uncharacterized protein (TIGR00369 family)